jgi:hypothetical protein
MELVLVLSCQLPADTDVRQIKIEAQSAKAACCLLPVAAPHPHISFTGSSVYRYVVCF